MQVLSRSAEDTELRLAPGGGVQEVAVAQRQVLTDALVQAVATQAAQPVVFMLWGAHAQSKRGLIDASTGSVLHRVLCANHPSPLSATRGPVPFIGCGHFGLAAQFLSEIGAPAPSW